MTESANVLERNILRAFFRSAKPIDQDLRWKRYRFDFNTLSKQLNTITHTAIPEEIVHEFSERLGLTVLRVDPIKLNIYGFERAFDRQAIAEGMGAVGVQFFPTRQSASRSAFESAREVAYFSAGPFENQFLECPIGRIMHTIHPDQPVPALGTIMRDMRDQFSSDEMIFDTLTKDIYFKANVQDKESLEAFQTALHIDPLSPAIVEKCTEFFNKRATIGIRDTMRWMLGSRHPWFDWNRAQKLILSAFANNKTTDFNTPQIVYYAYDPSIDEIDIETTLAHNKQIVAAFADSLNQALNKESPKIASLLQSKMEFLASWILDIHHDYPDFDLESAGCFGPSTHIDFLGHSIQNKVNQEFLGGESQMRLNLNMRAHFEARGLDKSTLDSLNDAERETFFATLQDVLAQYDKQLNIPENSYKRIPCILFLFQDLGTPNPRENERLLDAFDMSQMTQLEHASYMRSFPEISEKLVVFFTLTLRHMLETEHVPDLKPRDFFKDFMVLGLWGTRSPNIRINLYVDKSLDERDLAETLTRSEIRFVGTEQVETHPLEHIREEAKALRLAVAHFAPLIEPSILRNLGTFTMAMEEFRDSTHVFKTDPMSLLRYALDMCREAARWGIKGSVKDTLTVFEYLLDNSYDNLQKDLDRLSKHLKKSKK